MVLAHASSAYQHALKEVLSSPAVLSQIKASGLTHSLSSATLFLCVAGQIMG